MTMMALMQQIGPMAQGFGTALGGGNAGDWGNAFQGSVLGGYLSGKHAKKEQKKLKKQIELSRQQTKSIFGAGLGNQEAMSRLATQQQLGGYDTARKETERMGQASKQQAMDSETRNTAALSQSLADRGLGSTTTGANLQRGLASDTNRSIQGINQGLAGMFGNLAMGRAGVQAQGTQDLADLASQRTNFDINNAQFWLPQHLSQLGQLQGMKMGGGQVGGGASGGMGGIDMSQLMKLFGQMGGGGGGGMSMGGGSGGFGTQTNGFGG